MPKFIDRASIESDKSDCRCIREGLRLAVEAREGEAGTGEYGRAGTGWDLTGEEAGDGALGDFLLKRLKNKS
jgi:hypothetical protein